MESNQNIFRITSDIRLPYVPKGEALKLKRDITKGLRTLVKMDYTVLHATLTTSEPGFFDVENVLFYNVGTGNFSHLEVDALHFSLKDSGVMSKFEYAYEVNSEIESQFKNEKRLIDFTSVLPKLTSDLKPALYWSLIHKGEKHINRTNFELDKFGLVIELRLVKKHSNLISVIKPMLDGIVSALHFQENPSTATIEYIALKYNLDIKDVLDMFNEKSYSLLGKRDLVSAYRSGVKWNPADEKCISVVIKQHIADENSMRVSIYELDNPF